MSKPKTKIGAIVRQGDMVFMKVDSSELTNSKSVEKLTVGLGEVSGHSHEVAVTDEAEIVEFEKTKKRSEMLLVTRSSSK